MSFAAEIAPQDRTGPEEQPGPTGASPAADLPVRVIEPKPGWSSSASFSPS